MYHTIKHVIICKNTKYTCSYKKISNTLSRVEKSFEYSHTDVFVNVKFVYLYNLPCDNDLLFKMICMFKLMK